MKTGPRKPPIPDLQVFKMDIIRRDFLKYSGAAGSAALLGWDGGPAMASSKSRVAFLKAEDRAAAVAPVIDALGVNPARNKHVLIKPNFNAVSREYRDAVAAILSRG
jgi:hypothetical protein